MSINVETVSPTTEGAQAFLARKDQKMLIGGAWVTASSGETIGTSNPATGESLGTFPRADASDVDKAVAAARAAFEDGPWATMTPSDRARCMWKLADIMEANIDELAELETLDQGKPLFVSRWAEMPGSVEQFRYFGGMASKIEGRTIPSSINYQPEGKEMFNYTLREAVGVVGAIIPWNSPIIMAAMKLAPALAAGCTVVLKPAEDTSLTAIRLGEMICEAGFPEGVVNIVTGYGGEVGAAIAAHEGVDKVAFTGSTATGKEILKAAGGNLKKVTLELGGKSPAIIMDDADLELAIPGAANAIFFNSGQVCVAGSRLYVHAKVYDQVIEGIKNYAAGMALGNGMSDGVGMGPVVSRKQADTIKGYIDGAVADGATVAVGGGQKGDTGCFIEPTVLTNTNPDMAAVKEEIFGPVVVAEKFDSIDEIPAIANDSIYGLAASVWTERLSDAHRLAKRIKAGTIWINCHLMFDASLPIGGMKQSGWGRESGQEAMDNYLQTKTVISVI